MISKDVKKRRVCLVIYIAAEVIAILIALVNYITTYSPPEFYDPFNPPFSFGESLLVYFVSIISFLPLILYCIKPSLNKIVVFVMFGIFRIIPMALSELLFLKNRLPVMRKDEIVQLLLLRLFYMFLYDFLPYLIVLINVIFNKKVIEYICMISLLCYICFYICVLPFEFEPSLLYNLFTYFAMLFLWFTQISEHIGVRKEKVKIDIAPVQKKVAITQTSLEELKLLYDNGRISEEEYRSKRAEIIKNL